MAGQRDDCDQPGDHSDWWSCRFGNVLHESIRERGLRVSTVSPDPAVPASPAAAAPEPCPTPLNWVDVVTAVESEGQRISVLLENGEMLATVYGAGPPLYFIGGATGSARLFDLTAYLLKEEYTCVMVAAATWTAKPRALLNQTAEAICRLANSLGHAQFDLYAADFGCHVALTLLKHHTERVGHLLLQGPVLRQPTLARERFLQRLGQRLSRPMSTLPGWLRVQEQNHSGYFPPFDPTRYQFLLDELGASSVGQVSHRLIAVSQADWSEVVPEIRTPVLVLRCEGEGLALAQLSEEFTACLPGGRTESVALAGHYPYLTHPNRLVKIIKQFLHPVG